MAHWQAVFLDIDGTLVVNGHLVPSAGEAVQQLTTQGVRVALCTGRSVVHARPVLKALRLHSGVYFNGALVVDADQTIRAKPFSPATVQRIAHWHRQFRLPFILHTNAATWVDEPLPERFQPLLAAYHFPPLQTLPQPWPETVIQQVYQANSFAGRHWDQVLQNEFPECLLYRWHEEALDLQRRGCDKWQGAHALLQAWQIDPAHAIHIGDGGNDIGMFQHLGLGIAVGNAPPEVQAHATWVTAAADADGVYLALQRAGLLPR
ncbi:MAG: HAD family hydrolase [Alicyclobacillus sp.]|nr:HAD family hydrolase [Alicyclobacillus sp.]